MKRDSSKGLSLKSFYLKLLPDIKKRDMLLDMTSIYEELNTIVAPMYGLDVKLTISGKVGERLAGALKRGYSKHSGSVYFDVKRAIETIASQEDDVFKMVESTFNNEIIKAIIDYRSLNIIKYVESIHFFNQYARQLLTALVLEEFKDDPYLVTPVDKEATTFVLDPANINAFVKVIDVLTMDVSDFTKAIKNLEGFVFNEENYDAVKASNGRKLDPLTLGLLGNYNPFLFFGKLSNDWRLTRHERNKETLSKLQLTILALKQRQEKTETPEERERLEKQIKYHANRANRLNGKIEAMEEGL